MNLDLGFKEWFTEEDKSTLRIERYRLMETERREQAKKNGFGVRIRTHSGWQRTKEEKYKSRFIRSGLRMKVKERYKGYRF